MKLFGISAISSLLLTLAIAPEVKAFQFPNVSPDPDAPSYLFPDGVTPFTILKRGETTGGRYALGEINFQPGNGELPHFHQDEDGWFYVESGNLQILIGENIYDDPNFIPGVNAPRDILHALNAPAGTLIYTPRYRIHGVRNVSNAPGKLKIVWNPSGFENAFNSPGVIKITDLSNIPQAPPNYAQAYVQAVSELGLVGSFAYDQFGDIVVDNTLLNQDNRSNELSQLLADDVTQVPEPTSLVGFLIFGATGAISIWKRQRKAANKIA